ncbi:hypothetical protein BLA29_006945 [Euroglyphus maynei]|uniref:REKLES domain-containing protein n=1 Tax=Euroglyphus maynei TaxID=6958 RepID=A0A1Y3AZ71_EURMA|nr:hypothetical protein BLA29_006945 [Euroglyphus maynei]
MKYLYPYECEKEKLSLPEELQMAIDGNRREGRRSSYGQYPDLTNSPPPPPLPSSSSSASLQPPTSAQQFLNRNAFHHHHSRQHNRRNTNEALNLEINPRNSSTTSMAGSGNYNETMTSSSAKLGSLDRKTNYEDLFGVTPNKRFLSEENFLLNACNFPSTHLKISSKDGRTLDGQLTVSMEINGVLYHGILFAQTNNNSNNNRNSDK